MIASHMTSRCVRIVMLFTLKYMLDNDLLENKDVRKSDAKVTQNIPNMMSITTPTLSGVIGVKVVK